MWAAIITVFFLSRETSTFILKKFAFTSPWRIRISMLLICKNRIFNRRTRRSSVKGYYSESSRNHISFLCSARRKLRGDWCYTTTEYIAFLDFKNHTHTHTNCAISRLRGHREQINSRMPAQCTPARTARDSHVSRGTYANYFIYI